MDEFNVNSISDPAAPSEEQHTGLWRFVRDVIETLVLAAVLFAGINFMSARIRVDGYSMEPTLHTGEFIVVNKLVYKFGKPAYGDVIVFHPPRDPQQEYIKRVIGLAGDEVRINSGHVYVNGKVLTEPYIAAAPIYNMDWKVPENSVFVLGDNRNNSQDSHDWGPVQYEAIIGKALFIYWPPQSWGWIQSSPPEPLNHNG